MTKPHKKPTQLTQPAGEANAVTTPGPKRRQTAHRSAAADPEVRARIRVLRGRWKDAPDNERRQWIAQLLEKGCTIRGIAADIKQPESTVRLYSKPAPDGTDEDDLPDEDDLLFLQTRVSLNRGSGQVTTPVAVQEREPSSVKVQPVRPPDRPVPLRKLKLPKLPQRPPAPPPQSLLDREQSLDSLRWKRDEIFLVFLRTKLGFSDKPADATAVRNALALARIYTDRSTFFGWNCPKQLPDPISINRLFELTKLPSCKDPLDADQLGKWLTVIALSLGAPGANDFDKAERTLFPPPPPVDLTIDEFGRPLKPYQIRVREMAKRMKEAQGMGD